MGPPVELVQVVGQLIDQRRRQSHRSATSRCLRPPLVELSRDFDNVVGDANRARDHVKVGPT